MRKQKKKNVEEEKEWEEERRVAKQVNVFEGHHLICFSKKILVFHYTTKFLYLFDQGNFYFPFSGSYYFEYSVENESLIKFNLFQFAIKETEAAVLNRPHIPAVDLSQKQTCSPIFSTNSQSILENQIR